MSSALTELAEEFWCWRASTQPESYDDLTRIERPQDWTGDWSADAVAARRRRLSAFAERHRRLDLSAEPVAVQVDGRLIRSALSRVRWELDLLRGWQRNPCFYIDQALIPVFNLLLAPPPFDDRRVQAIVRQLIATPILFAQARDNLAGHAAAPFARYAMRLLDRADEDLTTAMHALAAMLPPEPAQRLLAAAFAAARALAAFRDWLGELLESFGQDTSVGASSFAYFLHRVALLPYPVQQLRTMGRQETDRAITVEAVLRRRFTGRLRPGLIADAAEQIARQHQDELAVRRFYTERGLLSQPEALRHYRFAPIPPYLAPLSWLGIPDDLTSPQRRDDDAVRYIPRPGPALPYFEYAKALDPLTAIVHEGAHAQQLALSWRHADPIRRHYYDSAPNEGIAFYNEELMLTSGLFDDAPASIAFIANAQRLRALRVEIDIGLALGDLTLDQAADRLADAVPMDRQTAWQGAAFFAGNPGQGLSYQIGKLQITELLADSVRDLGDAFDLRAFHDRLWREGNVPLVLQRWELLGRRGRLDDADRLATEAR
ncbi:MAG TPA: DUF885 family protein [Nonomuraea sp.]|nr:DUF885 family protein [Nonomuraea sp.]